MNIFILGHGMMAPAGSGSLKEFVHFYVKRGAMLDDFFIPGIIQIKQDLLPETSIMRLNRSCENNHGDLSENSDKNDHILFLSSRSEYVICTGLYKTGTLTTLWNYKKPTKLDFNSKFNLFKVKNEENIPYWSSVITEIKCDGHTLMKVMSYDGSSYLLYPDPNDETFLKTETSLRLSSIMKHFGPLYDYHWLACRQEYESINGNE